MKCYLSPIKALAHAKAKLVNPTIEIGGQTITFPTTLESGSYLEFRSMTDCNAYDAKGELIGDIKPQGQIPQLEAGANTVTFGGHTTKGVNARANVTIISQDDKFLGR